MAKKGEKRIPVPGKKDSLGRQVYKDAGSAAATQNGINKAIQFLNGQNSSVVDAMLNENREVYEQEVALALGDIDDVSNGGVMYRDRNGGLSPDSAPHSIAAEREVTAHISLGEGKVGAANRKYIESLGELPRGWQFDHMGNLQLPAEDLVDDWGGDGQRLGEFRGVAQWPGDMVEYGALDDSLVSDVESGGEEEFFTEFNSDMDDAADELMGDWRDEYEMTGPDWRDTMGSVLSDARMEIEADLRNDIEDGSVEYGEDGSLTVGSYDRNQDLARKLSETDAVKEFLHCHTLDPDNRIEGRPFLHASYKGYGTRTLDDVRKLRREGRGSLDIN